MRISIRRGLKRAIKKTLLRPPYIKHCPSTLYQSLLGCLRMWEATHAPVWSVRASRVAQLLVNVQNPDGGFDMGYGFDFSAYHRKGQSQSALQIALVALTQFSRVFGSDMTYRSMRRSVDWIRRYAIRLPGGKYAIAYSPDTVNEVRVYNGVSFACAALGCYLGYIESDAELLRIYHGMIAYLDNVMSQKPGMPGRFWYYHDQSCDHLDDMQRSKIDHYHQMMQVWFHALAEQAYPSGAQRNIVRDAADYVVAIHQSHGVIPYCNNQSYFKGLIHLWGLAAVIPGMLEASLLLPYRKTQYHHTARSVMTWILEHGWNGAHFEAILNPDGTGIADNQYMVRSDAWVFSALSHAQKHWGSGPWTSAAEQCYRKIEAVDFSGRENHAQTWTARACVRIVSILRRSP